MTALVINSIIGSGVFGLPSELTRLLGRASPIAMIVAGLAVAAIMLCIAEVASQFDEPGGPYLYTRKAFGILISIPTAANYLGVRSGATLTNVFTVAKLSPLALLMTLGVVRFGQHFEILHPTEITSPGVGPWLTALLLLIFAYGGGENALIPTGEVKEPRRTVPFGLLTGLLACIIVYTLVQFVTVATIGTAQAPRPLAQTASVLIGRGGAMFVAIAVMLSTYGLLSGNILSIPRIACSLSWQGDFPLWVGKLHPNFNTPATAILVYAAVVWLLAGTGTYLWLVSLTGGAVLVIYAASCGALIQLRRQQAKAAALRIPLGRVLSVIGILIAASLLTKLSAREALLMAITALSATTNWFWAIRRQPRPSS